MKLEGKVWKYGDNIDTDVIIPARYLVTTDPKVLAAHCMEDLDESFATSVQPGDIMVGGANFGCGSSREHAPISIKGAGVSCIIAEIVRADLLPQRDQHRPAHPGERRGRPRRAARRLVERGPERGDDHQRTYRQDLPGQTVPALRAADHRSGRAGPVYASHPGY